MSHVIFAFTTTFQLNFGLMVVISGFVLHKNCCEHTGRSFIPFVMVRRKSDTFNAAEVSNLYRLCVLYVVVLLAAFACWLTDQFGCELLYNLPFGLPNPQLHAWWHVLCGFNCHIGLQLSIGLREKALNQSVLPHTSWKGGFFPITNRKGRTS